MRKSLAIGVVTSLSLMSFAAPSPGAGEKPLTLDNLVITLGATTYRIPHIEIEGAKSAADGIGHAVFERRRKCRGASRAHFGAANRRAFHVERKPQ